MIFENILIDTTFIVVQNCVTNVKTMFVDDRNDSWILKYYG